MTSLVDYRIDALQSSCCGVGLDQIKGKPMTQGPLLSKSYAYALAGVELDPVEEIGLERVVARVKVVDVDDVYEIADILPATAKEKYSLLVSAAGSAAADELHLGYFKLSMFQ